MKIKTRKSLLVALAVLVTLSGIYAYTKSFLRDKKETVLVATMSRVGSTKTFNTVMKIYDVIGQGDYYRAYITYGSTDYKLSNRAKRHVIKIHDINNADVFKIPRKKLFKNAIVITAKRDPRDMVASRIGMNGVGPFFDFDVKDFGPMEEFLQHNREVYEFYKPYSNYEVDYEAYTQNPEKTIKEIAHALGQGLTEDQVTEVAKHIELIGDKEYLDSLEDKELHKMIINARHITGSKKVADYKNRLSPEYICKIEEKFGDWIVELGYRLDCAPNSSATQNAQ